MSRERNVVVVGAGVSGLAAAAVLARQGHRVRVVEANRKVGGCCATTTTGGYTFDDGALIVAFRGMLERVFERAGADLSSEVPLRRIRVSSTTWLPDGSAVTHEDGTDVVVEGGPRRFDPERTREELSALSRAWAPLFDLLTGDLLLREPSVSRTLARAWRFLPRLSRTVATELRRSVSDPAVRAALAGGTLFTGLDPERAPSTALLGIVATWREGVYLPEGGMGRIPEALAAAVRRHGGEVLLDAPVERIRVSDGRVRGVEVRGHGALEADAVVSTVNAVSTFGLLLERGAVPTSMARRARRAAVSHRGVSIQLGLRNRLDARAYEQRVLPMLEEQGRYFDGSAGAAGWLAWAVPTAVNPALAPDGGSVVEVFPPIDQRVSMDGWDEERTARTVEAAIEALSRHHRLDIAVRRVRSPRDFARELHLHEGGLYGLSTATSPFALFPRRAGIRGLYLAGQTTYPGSGIPTSAASGVLAADAVHADAG